MLSLVRGFFGRKTVEASHAAPTVNQNQTPSSQVLVDGAPAFALSQHIRLHEGYPILDWQAVQAWIDELASPALRALAWAAVERGWLLHMRAALGAGFQLQESGTAMLLSSLEANIARATMDYMERTLGRVLKLLDGIAEIAPMGKDILIVFDDDESYYRYASYYYPEGGEFALSGGMHIDSGCSHYVTIRSDLREGHGVRSFVITFQVFKVNFQMSAKAASTSRCQRLRALIHHSDRGSQYVSILYTERLAQAGIEPSVGSRGDSYDNALAETINGLYKTELIHRRAP